jgi:hypothetical protein
VSHRTHNGHLAEQHTESVFWRPAIIALLALAAGCLVAALTGCASSGYSLTQGGMSDATSSFASDHSYSYSCSKFDPVSGVMTDQVTVSRNINPNAQAVGAMAAAFQSVVGLVGAIARPPVPVPLGTRPGIPPGYTLDVPTCLGEHGVNTPMPAPVNPIPPAQSVAPTLDERGAAHSADDGRSAP